MTRDEVEVVRAQAAVLLKERYNGNQSAFARDIGIQSTNIRRFVINKKGGVSSQTAKKIQALLSQGTAPVLVPKRAKKVVVESTSPLESVLSLMEGRWPPVVVEIARLIDKHIAPKRTGQEWFTELDEIQEWLAKM